MIHLLQIYIDIDSLPQLRSGPTGKIFTGGKSSGEGECTTQQDLSLWSWAPDTLFLLLKRCWGHFIQVHIAGNQKMRTYFVFYHIYATPIDVGRFRGPNKDGNIFIYTTKHVLSAQEHIPAKGAKVRKCFISYHMLNCPWRRSRHTNEQKKRFIILCYTYRY
jgi:hypothetical protein